MNKSILIFLLSLSTCFNSNAQDWIKQESNTTSHLWDVHFINSKFGIIVGANGVILKTTDGGENWIQKASGTKKIIRAVYLIDSISGFAITNNEILKTIDGGESWFLQDTLNSPILRDIQFIDQNVGYIVGDGQLLKTTDQGNNWIAKNGPGFSISEICAVDTANLFITGGDQIIVKSTDGGDSWNLVHPMNSFPMSTFNGIYFTSKNIGYAVGGGLGKTSASHYNYGIIKKTSNGGLSWYTVKSGRGSYLQSIFFVNDKTGYATSRSGEIFKTSNAGGSWVSIESGVNVALQSIHFPDLITGYAVGYDGNIFKTTIISSNINDHNLKKFNVEYFPNPVKDILTIKCNLYNKSMKLSILDINGSEIIARQLTDYKTQIDLSKFRKGLYIVQISSDENIETFMVIKQ